MVECEPLALVYCYGICSGYRKLRANDIYLVKHLKLSSDSFQMMLLIVTEHDGYSIHLVCMINALLNIVPIAPLTNPKVTSMLRRSITLQPTFIVIIFSRPAV